MVRRWDVYVIYSGSEVIMKMKIFFQINVLSKCSLFRQLFLFFDTNTLFPKVSFSLVSFRSILKEKIEVYIGMIPTDPHRPLNLLLLQPGLPHLPDVGHPLD